MPVTSSVELEDNQAVQWNVSDNVPCNNALRIPLEKERGLFIVVP